MDLGQFPHFREDDGEILFGQQLLHGLHELVAQRIQHVQVVIFRVHQFTDDKVTLL